jgi:hypothetical protein
MHIKSILYNSIDMFPKKPNTLAGFEPGSSVPEADAMSTASRRHDNKAKKCHNRFSVLQRTAISARVHLYILYIVDALYRFEDRRVWGDLKLSECVR